MDRRDKESPLGLVYAQLPAAAPPPVFAIDRSNIGFQLLERHGWKEGAGLGAEESGRLAPIATRLKNDRHVIGISSSSSGARKRVTHSHEEIMEHNAAANNCTSSFSATTFLPFKVHVERTKKDEAKRKAIMNYLKSK